MKKPSDWTTKEAWKEACNEASRRMIALWNSNVISIGEASRTLFETSRGVQEMPFPSDPVERVSDEELRRWMTGYAPGNHFYLAFSELIERRARDKEKQG